MKAHEHPIKGGKLLSRLSRLLGGVKYHLRRQARKARHTRYHVGALVRRQSDKIGDGVSTKVMPAMKVGIDRQSRKMAQVWQTLGAGTKASYRRYLSWLEQKNQGFEGTTKRLWRWQQQKRLEMVDGLLEECGLDIVFNGHERLLVKDRRQGYSFAFFDLSEVERVGQLTLKLLSESRCPIKRIDVGFMGSSGISSHIRWVEEQLQKHGVHTPGWFDQLQAVAKMISHSQLTYRSYMVALVEKAPRSVLSDLAGNKDRSNEQLMRYVLGLFYPLTDFDQTAWLDFMDRQMDGQPILKAVVSSQVERLAQGIKTEGGLYHMTIRVRGLGAVPREDNPKAMLIRQPNWLRGVVIQAVESPGETVRIATTLWPIREKRRGNLRSRMSDGIAELEKYVGSPTRPLTEPEKLHLAALRQAKADIEGYPTLPPFFQSIIIDVQSNTPEGAVELLGRVCDYLDKEMVSYYRVTDPQEHWENLLAFLPTIRKREVNMHVNPIPASCAEMIFERVSTALPVRGVLMGFKAALRSPFILPMGGNYFLVGTSGSGKSMAAKILAYRLIPLNPRWTYRLMDNTDTDVESAHKLRGWVDLVNLFGGETLFAGDFESGDQLKNRLRDLANGNCQVVLFHSVDSKPAYDKIYMEWIASDMKRRNPGVVVIDETAHWFVDRLDERGRYFANNLLTQFGKWDTMSFTTIQSLGVVRESDRAVYEGVMTNINAGKFAFYTPHVTGLPSDLGISEIHQPALARFIVETVTSFKLEDAGPLQRPGWAVFVDGSTAYEVKIAVSPETLNLLARKDMSREDDLWGL